VTPEGKVKAKVKALLKEFRAYMHMPVQNGMGEPTLDFIACLRGHFIAVETKAPGKKPTKRQEVTMQQMIAAGAFVFVISTDAEVLVLRCYLELLA
jgi:hypothetical protein